MFFYLRQVVDLAEFQTGPKAFQPLAGGDCGGDGGGGGGSERPSAGGFFGFGFFCTPVADERDSFGDGGGKKKTYRKIYYF